MAKAELSVRLSHHSRASGESTIRAFAGATLPVVLMWEGLLQAHDQRKLQ